MLGNILLKTYSKYSVLIELFFVNFNFNNSLKTSSVAVFLVNFLVDSMM